MPANQRELIVLILKGLLAWCVLSGLVIWFRVEFANSLFPLTRAVIMLLTTDVSTHLEVSRPVQGHFDDSIEMIAWVLKPLYLNVNHFIPPGTELKASVHLLHLLVPVVIEGTILLIWPAVSWGQRLQLLGLGLLTSLLIILATLPVLLVGHLEISFQEIAFSNTGTRRIPWFVDWLVFCEMGGSWLLAISAAWLCIQLQHVLPSNHDESNIK